MIPSGASSFSIGRASGWKRRTPLVFGPQLLYAKSIGQENKIDRMWLTAALPHLDRRARYRAVGTEYAAIAWLWHEVFPTALAVVKEPAGVLRH
jgi:hypothetical protein